MWWGQSCPAAGSVPGADVGAVVDGMLYAGRSAGAEGAGTRVLCCMGTSVEAGSRPRRGRVVVLGMLKERVRVPGHSHGVG